MITKQTLVAGFLGGAAAWMAAFSAVAAGTSVAGETARDSVAQAAPPSRDVTGSLEYVCNPNKIRWPNNATACSVSDLHFYGGRLYAGGGDTGSNPGPVYICPFDPYTGVPRKEYSAGTENINRYYTFSDGRLWAPAMDPHEGDPNEGHFFRRELDGAWVRRRTFSGSVTDGSRGVAFSTHIWDMQEFDGKVFCAGYGLSSSTNWGDTTMVHAAPSSTNVYRLYSDWVPYVSNGKTYHYQIEFYRMRRFMCFFRFDDALFAIPTSYMKGDNLSLYHPEVWRYSKTTGQFTMETVPWANLVPGFTTNDLALTGGESENSPLDNEFKPWHPTLFKGRVLYVAGALGDSSGSACPWFGCSAALENGTIKATRIDLGTGVFPWDFAIAGDRALVLASQYIPATKMVRNSVWESSDGVAFSETFAFTNTQPAVSLEYHDGAYYLGMGCRKLWPDNMPLAWAADQSGDIYRVRLPREPTAVTAEVAAVSLAEGASRTVRFRLAAAPATNMALKVWTTDCAALSTTGTSLTFTKSNWDRWQEITATLADDLDGATPVGAIVCGTADGQCASAAVRVAPVENDFPPAAATGVVVRVTHRAVSATVVVTNFGSSASIAVRCRVLASDGGEVAAGEAAGIMSTGAVTVAIGGLSPATSYLLQVIAVGANGLAATNPAVAFATDLFPFQILSAAAAAPAGGGAARLTVSVRANAALASRVVFILNGAVAARLDGLALAAGVTNLSCAADVAAGATNRLVVTVEACGEKLAATRFFVAGVGEVGDPAYLPGLRQAKFSGGTAIDMVSDIADAPGAERVLGTIMDAIVANKGTAATVGATNSLTGKVFHFNATQTTFGYSGEIFLEAGATYIFGKLFDDGAVIRIGGETVLSNMTWNAFATGRYMPTTTGWFAFEVRLYDGDGGKGPAGDWKTAGFGLAYNTNGLAKANAGSGWTAIRDPGDGSFLRAPVLTGAAAVAAALTNAAAALRLAPP